MTDVDPIRCDCECCVQSREIRNAIYWYGREGKS